MMLSVGTPLCRALPAALPAVLRKHALTDGVTVWRRDDQRQPSPIVDHEHEVGAMLRIPMKQVGDPGTQQHARDERPAAWRLWLSGALRHDGDRVADANRRDGTGCLDATQSLHDGEQVVVRDVSAHVGMTAWGLKHVASS